MLRVTLSIILSLTLAACASEAPIRKTNCWSGASSMALLPSADCEFVDVAPR